LTQKSFKERIAMWPITIR